MSAHILTVDATTFKAHLNYMFIGTGKNGSAHQGGALADILCIRPLDDIIFYVQGYGFYGIFKANGDVFYDYNSYNGHSPQYLDNLLGGKTLTYRALISASEVYESGISEWDMMENPDNIAGKSIFNLQWSWIFKKLNASRGCLSIDNHEFELFKDILKTGNTKLTNLINYDFNNSKIVALAGSSNVYNPQCTTQSPRNINRLTKILNEEDLRIFFTAKSGIDPILDTVLQKNNNGDISFISDEVLCSFSERKMDLVIGTKTNNCLLIELKNDFIFNDGIYNQIKEYSRWGCAYKLQYEKVIPILVIKEAPETAAKRGCKYFKYLSQEDKTNNEESPWYKDIIQKMTTAKQMLSNQGIKRLADLQIYTFSTDINNNLLGFRRLI